MKTKIDTDGINPVIRSDGNGGVEMIVVGPGGQIGKPLPISKKGFISLLTSMSEFMFWAWRK